MPGVEQDHLDAAVLETEHPGIVDAGVPPWGRIGLLRGSLSGNLAPSSWMPEERDLPIESDIDASERAEGAGAGAYSPRGTLSRSVPRPELPTL